MPFAFVRPSFPNSLVLHLKRARRSFSSAAAGLCSFCHVRPPNQLLLNFSPFPLWMGMHFPNKFLSLLYLCSRNWRRDAARFVACSERRGPGWGAWRPSDSPLGSPWMWSDASVCVWPPWTAECAPSSPACRGSTRDCTESPISSRRLKIEWNWNN